MLMVTLAMHMIDIVQNALRAQANMITITLDERGDESLLLFQVEDDGSGMSPEILERLSDPFTTRTTRRVGLGIPFLKMTCEQTGGTLRVSSAEGEAQRLKLFIAPIILTVCPCDLEGVVADGDGQSRHPLPFHLPVGRRCSPSTAMRCGSRELICSTRNWWYL